MSPSENLFVAARAYATGAHAIVKSNMRAQYKDDLRFVIPCMMLIGHSIELYLKSWLAHSGYNADTLRKKFGHDLRRLYEEARSLGLPEPPMPPQQSIHDLVESYEVDHGDLRFRYPTDGWRFEVPRMDLLFEILVLLDQVVATTMGKLIPDDLEWSVSAEEDFRLPTS